MSLFATTLQALAPLFCLILLGYALKRVRILHAAHVPVMNGIVVNVTLPALAMKGLVSAPVLSSQAALPPVLNICVELTLMLAAYFLGKALRLPKQRIGALLLISVFGNTGFLGYPMTLALISKQFPEAILIDQFGMNIPLYTGILVVSAMFSPLGLDSASQRTMLIKLLRSPLLCAIYLALAIRAIPWPAGLTEIPLVSAATHVIASCVDYLSKATVPLILLSFGVSLQPGAARKDLRALAIAAPLKLLVSPLLMWELCRLFHITGELRSVSVLLASMPTSVMASVLCSQHDLDGDLAVGIVFVTTILSAVTIPLVQTWLR